MRLDYVAGLDHFLLRSYNRPRVGGPLTSKQRLLCCLITSNCGKKATHSDGDHDSSINRGHNYFVIGCSSFPGGFARCNYCVSLYVESR